MIKLYVFIGLILVFAGCAGQKQMTSARISKDGTEMLYGKISRAQLFFDYPEWQEVYDRYTPDQETVQKTRELHFSGRIYLFLGTWCKDSRREVPRMFKIFDQINLTNAEKIRIWAVDRAKKLADDLTDTYDIYFVPTVIFFGENGEIGRIVEQPEVTLEEDILRILSKGK